jgi:amidase
MTPIPDMSMRAMAAAIRAGKLTATEVVRAHLKRIDHRNGEVNAVIRRNDEAAIVRAAQADAAARKEQWWGPLHGVPFTVKDMFATKSIPTTFGMPHLAEHRPEKDATLVRRYREAGAILIGKTNLPTFSYDWQTEHPRYGRCNNPFDPERTVGGSSGGSAASVASGMAAFDIGSDVAGSIRVPCHHCHVFGIRPTEGVLPDEGHGAMPTANGTVEHITVVGPIARTAADLELLFRVGTRQAVRLGGGGDCDGLRIGWSDALGQVPLSEEVASALDDFRTRLGEAGAEVIDVRPPVPVDEAVELWGRINGYELAHAFPKLATLPGIKQATAWWFFEKRLGKGALAGAAQEGFNSERDAFDAALDRREEVMRTTDAFFDDVDLWLAPALPVPPFEHRPTGTPIEVDGEPYPYADLHAGYQCSVALLGTPVVSMPIGMTEDGLPVGIQVIGRRHDDLRLLERTRTLSRVLPGDRTEEEGANGSFS